MNLRLTRSVLMALAVGLVVAGCQEQLTSPGSCPATCPGGTPELRDTVLDAIEGGDSLFSGYLTPGASLAGIRVANGLLGATEYGVIRFSRRLDSITVRDTARGFTIDSVVLELPLLKRDTTVSGIVLSAYRLPAATDSGVDYATVDGQLVPGNLLDSVTIADSLTGVHVYKFVFKDSTLARVAIAGADSGVLALALQIAAPTPTGVRMAGLGSQNAGGIPKMWTYVTVDVPDTVTSVKKQSLLQGPELSTFVSSAPAPAPDDSILAVGTRSATRAYLRFDFPAYLRDSALLARATLELVPATAFTGLPGDSAFIDVRGVRADFGRKSPITGLVGTEPMPFGSLDTLRIEVVSEIVNWQLDRLAHPPILLFGVSPEGASFTEPRFYSTQSAVPARRPRLRITYQLPFDFERP